MMTGDISGRRFFGRVCYGCGCPAKRFKVLERWPQMRWDAAPAELCRKQWTAATSVSQNGISQAAEIVIFGFVQSRDSMAQRPDKAVAKEHPEEGANERRGHFVADLGRRPAKRTHSDNDAEDG